MTKEIQYVDSNGRLLSRTEQSLKEQVADHATQLAQNVQQLGDIAVYISAYQRQSGETDDTGRFTRAISALTSHGGGTLILENQTYLLQSFTIPNSVTIKGQGMAQPYATSNATILKYSGTTGTFITINSYYQQQAKLIGLQVTAATQSQTANTVGIFVKRDTNDWGASALIQDVNVIGFGVGIRHAVTYQSIVRNCVVTACGIGISYKAEIIGANPPQTISSTFGNENVSENNTVFLNNVGYEIASDINNTIRYGDVEQNKIGILYYQSSTSGMLPPQYMSFENCWIEKIILMYWLTVKLMQI